MKRSDTILSPSIQRAPEDADDLMLSLADDDWMEELEERESVRQVRRKVGTVRSFRSGKYQEA